MSRAPPSHLSPLFARYASPIPSRRALVPPPLPRTTLPPPPSSPNTCPPLLYATSATPPSASTAGAIPSHSPLLSAASPPSSVAPSDPSTPHRLRHPSPLPPPSPPAHPATPTPPLHPPTPLTYASNAVSRPRGLPPPPSDTRPPPRQLPDTPCWNATHTPTGAALSPRPARLSFHHTHSQAPLPHPTQPPPGHATPSPNPRRPGPPLYSHTTSLPSCRTTWSPPTPLLLRTAVGRSRHKACPSPSPQTIRTPSPPPVLAGPS